MKNDGNAGNVSNLSNLTRDEKRKRKRGANLTPRLRSTPVVFRWLVEGLVPEKACGFNPLLNKLHAFSNSFTNLLKNDGFCETYEK